MVRPSSNILGMYLAEELLAQHAVVLGFDAEVEVAVLLDGGGRAVEHHQGSPPAVERVLDHVALDVRAVHHGDDHVVAVLDVEAFFPADLLHGAGVGRVGGVEEGLLRLDGGGVYQPGDDGRVAPVEGGVVEDVVELGLARQEVGRASPRGSCRGLRPRGRVAGRGPTSSCTLAVRASLRLRVGALLIHSRSGSTPISSELACISTNLSTCMAVFLGHPVARLLLCRPFARRR